MNDDFYTIRQITTDCQKLIEIATQERQCADAERQIFLSGALFAFRAILRLLELLPSENLKISKNEKTESEVHDMDGTIKPYDIFYKRLEDFTAEELVLIHRNLFELTERPANDDLLYSGDRQTSLNRLLDVVALLVNQLLIAKLLEQKGQSSVSR